MSSFEALKVRILGVSRDSVSKHQGFKKNQDLHFTLLADTTGDLCRSYDVLCEKQLFGRKYLGIERATFVVGQKGTIIKIWRKVKPKGHAEAVLAFLESCEVA